MRRLRRLMQKRELKH
ncbi:hypothetical protein [Christiangramia sp. SM2212]